MDGGEEAKKAAQGIIDAETIVRFTPPSIETLRARQSAISVGSIRIIPLTGQEASLLEYLGDNPKRAWEFEPFPNLETIIDKESTDQLTEVTLKANEHKLWQYLAETAETIKKETDISLDIRNLTPHQAMFLINTLILKKMHYEYLLLSANPARLVEIIGTDPNKTSRPDILELALKDENKFKKEVQKLSSKLDSMPADQLIGYGFGVCRHIAAITRKLYETLKKQQLGLLLNGSYVITHNERTGNQENTPVVNNHAYNIFIVTSPQKGHEPTVLLTVTDPTWMLDEPDIPDRTNERISQAISFLSEFGSHLKLYNPQVTAQKLAEIAASRIECYLSENYDRDTINDYTALLVQTGRSPEDIINTLRSVYTRFGVNEIDFLSLLFLIPAFTSTHSGNMRIIRDFWETPLAKEISHIRFDQPELAAESTFLKTHLDQSISLLRPQWFGTLTSRRKIDIFRGPFCLINELIRACAELQEAPSEKSLVVIMAAYRADEKTRANLINRKMLGRLTVQLKKDRP